MARHRAVGAVGVGGAQNAAVYRLAPAMKVETM